MSFKSVGDYFKRKSRPSSVSPIVSFDSPDLTDQEKVEKQMYSVTVSDVVKEFDSNYEDLVKMLNTHFLDKLDEVFKGQDLSKSHLKYLNNTFDTMNLMLDESDNEATKILSTEVDDKNINVINMIEILLKGREQNDTSIDYEIVQLTEEIKKNVEVRNKLLVEVEFDKKLLQIKKEKALDVENKLKFLDKETENIGKNYDKNLFDRKLEIINDKCKKFNDEIDSLF